MSNFILRHSSVFFLPTGFIFLLPLCSLLCSTTYPTYVPWLRPFQAVFGIAAGLFILAPDPSPLPLQTPSSCSPCPSVLLWSDHMVHQRWAPPVSPNLSDLASAACPRGKLFPNYPLLARCCPIRCTRSSFLLYDPPFSLGLASALLSPHYLPRRVAGGGSGAGSLDRWLWPGHGQRARVLVDAAPHAESRGSTAHFGSAIADGRPAISGRLRQPPARARVRATGGGGGNRQSHSQSHKSEPLRVFITLVKPPTPAPIAPHLLQLLTDPPV